MIALSPAGVIPQGIMSALPLDAFATVTGLTPAAYHASWAVFGLKTNARGLGIFPISIFDGMAVGLTCTPVVAVGANIDALTAALCPVEGESEAVACGLL